MRPRKVLQRFLGWVPQSRRSRLLGALAAVTLVAVAVAGSIYLAGRSEAPPATPTPLPPLACDAPPLIDPLPQEREDGWRRVAAPPADDCFSLSPTVEDVSGIAPESGFVLVSKDPLDAAALAERIRAVPALDLEIEPLAAEQASARPDLKADYRYSIRSTEPMASGQVYRFTLLDSAGETPLRTWAFQTQSVLRVVQTLPADQSTEVPLNIGIELTFSHDGVDGVEARWEIAPAVQGRFEVHKRVVAFVPKELQANTLYTVTLKPGVTVPDSELEMTADFRFQFETGSEERTGETPGGPPRLQFSRLTWEASTGEPPALALFGYDAAPAKLTLPFTAYRFAGADKFLAALDEFTSVPTWASFTRSRTTVDTGGLEKAASFEADVPEMGEFGDRYVLFPAPLPAGYYLVEATFEKRQLQALLQVADVAAYVSLSGTRTIVWVNDVVAKSPLRGATVTATDATLSAVTDAAGVAVFDTPKDVIELRSSPYGYTTKETVGNLIVTAADGRKVIVPLVDIFSQYKYFGFREYAFAGDPSLYWRFLYTDRHLYRPSDTVSFWGIVRRRENPPPSQELVVEITGSRYDEKGFYQSSVVVASRVLTTTAAGTFLGQLAIEGVSPGYYELRARAGEQVIASTYVEVADYVKPSYKLDVLPSRRAVFAGDKAEYEVRASFFDGSPVPNLELRITDKSGEGTLTTDESGKAVYSRTASLDGDYGPYSMDFLNVAPTLAEEGEITGSAWVQVFPAALTVDAEATIADGTATVSGTVLEVDLERLNSDAAAAMEDYRGGPAPGRVVSADIVRYSYERIETGESYDFVAKIVRKTYRYQQTRTRIGSESVTSAADGTFTFSFPAGGENSYEVTLRVTDDDGRSFRTEAYAYSPFNYYGMEPVLVPDGQEPYAVGDEVAVTMTVSDRALPAGGGNRYLFYLAQNGIRSHAVSDSPRYSFPFGESDVPNVSVMAVRFTGSTYQEVGYPYSAPFDRSARELTVNVQPGKDRYAPGEDATLEVTVTDREGRPVQAEVLLSAVDEAVFRLQGEAYFFDLDILETLYTSVSSGILRTYASHQYPLSSPAAERGGGGGDRDNFKDVALFQSVTTNAKGHGTATFQLPDNITSWRVTALALSPGLYAGTGLGFVPVGLPLFVDVAMNSSYLSADVASVKVRAFGEALAAGDDVTFQLSSPTLAAQPITVGGKAFEPVDVALPPLKEGRHELTFAVSAKGLKDSVVRSITVVPSRLLRSKSHFYELQPGQSAVLQGAATGPTTVVLSDHNRGRYYPVLRSLSWTYGDRLDQMLARNLAQELLLQHFGEAPDFPAEFTASAYQTADGGIAIFPFADDDLQLSARAAALAPERFGQQALSQYFQTVIDDPEETRERVLIALYGQAALGQPVLAQVQAAAALDDLSPRERLYAGLATAELGDEDTARAIYGKIIAGFGERRGQALRINAGNDQDDILEATSLAAVLAAALRDDYAPLLFEYTLPNYRHETLIELEQISYLVAALPALFSGPVQFTYVLEGEMVRGRLERGESRTLVVSPEQLASLDLRGVDGAVGVTTAYLTPFDPASVEPDPEVSLSRSYPAQSDDAVTLREGALVRITLRWTLGKKAVDGCYQVSDLLPSGLKPVSRLFEQGIRDTTVSYPYLIEGQRVSFCVSRGEPNRPIVYYARVVGTGTYNVEPAVIQSQRANESMNVTGSMEAEIR
ncbi:MAG TPA: MG2 domain-containing protein [Dehalococcoidia bacterium]|nr:MG2 domain-containing protein [Dehalococcoidia bacterium]